MAEVVHCDTKSTNSFSTWSNHVVRDYGFDDDERANEIANDRLRLSNSSAIRSPIDRREVELEPSESVVRHLNASSDRAIMNGKSVIRSEKKTSQKES